jgi:hypothetical protein
VSEWVCEHECVSASRRESKREEGKRVSWVCEHECVSASRRESKREEGKRVSWGEASELQGVGESSSAPRVVARLLRERRACPHAFSGKTVRKSDCER